MNPPMSHFQLLGMPQKFSIDEAQLRRAYRALAKDIHPDRFMDKDEQRRILATQLSADLNSAMAVLSDPAKRASYLLELAGGPSAIDVRDVPGALLAEVMMLHEEIKEALEGGNAEALADRRRTVAAKRDEALGEIATYADAMGDCSDGDKADCRKLLNSMKYYDNLLKLLATDPLAGGGGA